MATFRFTSPQIFPEGTSIGAYPGNRQLSEPGHPPLGDLIDAQTIVDGECVFTGLENNQDYVAAAQIDGEWRKVRFHTELPLAAGVTEADLDELLQGDAMVEGSWAFVESVGVGPPTDPGAATNRSFVEENASVLNTRVAELEQGSVARVSQSVANDYTFDSEHNVAAVNSPNPAVVTIPDDSLLRARQNELKVVRLGGGSVTIEGDTGVTILSPTDTFTIDKINGTVTCVRVQANTWVLDGSLTVGVPPPPPTTYTLTVSRSGSGAGNVTSQDGGIDTAIPDNSHVYSDGTIVNLLAGPDNNSVFGGWTGGVTDATPQIAVTMNADKTIDANFDPIPPPSSGGYILPNTGALLKRDDPTNADPLVFWKNLNPGPSSRCTRRSGDGCPHPRRDGQVIGYYRRLQLQDEDRGPGSDPPNRERQQLGTSNQTSDAQASYIFRRGERKHIFIPIRLEPVNFAGQNPETMICQFHPPGEPPTISMSYEEDPAGGYRMTMVMKPAANQPGQYVWRKHVPIDTWLKIALDIRFSTSNPFLQVWGVLTEANSNLVPLFGPITNRPTMYSTSSQTSLMVGPYQNTLNPPVHEDFGTVEVCACTDA